MVLGGGSHHRAPSFGGGCAAWCGGEIAEGGDGICHFVGKTGEDGRLAAEHGGLGAQRLKRVEAPSATVRDGFGEELAEVFQLARDPVADSLGQRLIGVRINLAAACMNQRGGDPVPHFVGRQSQATYYRRSVA